MSEMLLGTNKSRKGRFKHASSLVSLVLVILGFLLINPAKVFASVIWNAGQQASYKTQMPAFNFSTLNNCGGGASPAYTQWVAKPGAPTTSVVQVNYKDTTVGLNFNYNGAVCTYSPNSVIDTLLRVNGASVDGGASITGINGDMHLIFGAGAKVGTYQISANGFNLNLASGFQNSSQTFHVTVNFRQLNHFPSGYVCVGNNKKVGAGQVNLCPQVSLGVAVTVNVFPNRPPWLYADVECNGYDEPDGFYVTARDPDSPTDQSSFGVSWQLENYDTSINKWVPGLANKGTTNDIFGTGTHRKQILWKNSNLPDDQEHRVHVWTYGWGPQDANNYNDVYAENKLKPGTFKWGPCVKPDDQFQLVHKVVKTPVLVPDDQNPKKANFYASLITNGRAPVKNGIPRIKRDFCIIKLGSATCTIFLTRPAPLAQATIPDDNNGRIYIDNLVTLPNGIMPGDQICEIFTTPLGGLINLNPKSAKFHYWSSIDPQAKDVPTRVCASTYVKSYFSVYGGDVFAGVSGTCGPGWANSTSAGIYAFRGRLNGSAKSNMGAGGEAGVFALGPINDSGIYGFMSARLRTSFPIPQTDLTFANTNGL
ncbi:MAG TPA: hypothetical protein VLF39_03685, partial [Candidatus Saccharimonadales bacterium]|nr:hypothetical protein [Candidatus Saccharimonadales bacterium]